MKLIIYEYRDKFYIGIIDYSWISWGLTISNNSEIAEILNIPNRRIQPNFNR